MYETFGAMPRDDDDLIGRLLAALQETAEWQWIGQQMRLDALAHEMEQPEPEDPNEYGRPPIRRNAGTAVSAQQPGGSAAIQQDGGACCSESRAVGKARQL